MKITGSIKISILMIMLMPAMVFADSPRSHESLAVSPAINIEAITQVILGLILVVGLILAAALVYKKTGRYAQNNIRNLGVMTGFSIGGKERIILVRAGNEQILVGVGPGVIQTLHVLEKPLDNVQEKKDQGRSFIEKLNSELKKITS